MAAAAVRSRLFGHCRGHASSWQLRGLFTGVRVHGHATDSRALPLRVGGVPEHFNGPFHWSMAEGGAYSIAQPPLPVVWHTYPKGTGEMIQALESGEVDVACVLLEGAVAAITKGAPLRIFGTYVSSPLTWGVHVKAESSIASISDLRGKMFGVSRMGSGSHLMACVMALQQGWSMEDVPMHVTGSLDDAREAMKAGKIDAWLWEKFTTNFLVEQGEWKRVGEVPTPWPCFVFVAKQATCAERTAELRRLLDLTRPVCQEYKKNLGGSTVKYVSENHRLPENLSEDWLKTVEWSCSSEVSPEALAKASSLLLQTGQVSKELPAESLVASI